VPFPELPEASTRRHLDDGWRVGAADYCWWWRVVAVLDAAAGKIGVVRDEGTVHVRVMYEDAAAAAFCQWQRLPLGRSVGIPWLIWTADFSFEVSSKF